MTHPNKRRGNDLERELVNTAREHNIPAKRAFASDGRSLGYTEGVDCVIGVDEIRLQAKRQKKLPKWFLGLVEYFDQCDAVVVRQDRSSPYVIMEYEKWLSHVVKD